MSIANGGSVSNHYTIADAAGLSLPASDWCMGFWLYLASNTGTGDQNFISTNNNSASNRLNIYLRGTSSGTSPNRFRFDFAAGGTSWVSIATVNTPANSGWNLIIAQRRATDSQFQLWWCPFVASSPTATKIVGRTIASEGVSDGGIWNITRRSGATNPMQNTNFMAEVFMGNFSLSQSEIEQLGSGLPITQLYTPVFYLPFYTNEATVEDKIASYDATKSGSPTTGTHHPSILNIPTTPATLTLTATGEDVIAVNNPATIIVGSSATMTLTATGEAVIAVNDVPVVVTGTSATLTLTASAQGVIAVNDVPVVVTGTSATLTLTATGQAVIAEPVVFGAETLETRQASPYTVDTLATPYHAVQTRQAAPYQVAVSIEPYTALEVSIEDLQDVES